MSDDEITARGDLGDIVKQRTAALRQPSKRQGLRPQQIAGIASAVVLVVGAIGYALLSSDGGSLSGATPRNFDQPRGGNPNLSIARPSAAEPTVTAAVPPALPTYQPADNSADLARLNELTTAQAEAQRIIDALKQDLDNAGEAVATRDERIADLTKRLEKEETRYSKLQRDTDSQSQLLRSRVSALEGQLQIANSRNNLSPVNSSDDEQAKRLEEARKRRQLQIESEGLIFDGSRDTNTIRY